MRYQEVPDKAWPTQRSRAASPSRRRASVETLQSIRTQTRRFEVTDTIIKLGGARPKTFEEFVREQQNAFSATGTSLRGRAMNRRKFLQTTLLPLALQSASSLFHSKAFPQAVRQGDTMSSASAAPSRAAGTGH